MTTWIDLQDKDKVAANLEALRGSERGRQMIERAGGDERFALWLVYVDRRVMRKTGLGVFDLEDWMSRDAYDGGMSPAEGAIEAISNDSTYSEWFDPEVM